MSEFFWVATPRPRLPATWEVTQIALKKLEEAKYKTFSEQNPAGENRDIFGLFNNRILELSNHTFSPMYAKIFKRYWHNSMIARMSRNYCVTKWRQGIYEVYIPTRANLDSNMQYYRITIKVLPEADKETVKKQLIKVIGKHVNPAGIVDSELICFVAPRRSDKARRQKQFLRGFKHTNKPGYLTAIIINPVPEICMKRLLTIIAKFFKTRIKKLLEKLNFQPWQYDYRKKNYLYYTKLCNIIEEFSYLIANTLRSLSHSLNWILLKLKWLLKEIGHQNMLKMAVKKFYELKNILADTKFDKRDIVAKMEAVLVAATARSNYAFRPKSYKRDLPTPLVNSRSSLHKHLEPMELRILEASRRGG